MSDRYRATDSPGLVKDIDSGALLYLDTGRIREHRAKKRRQETIDQYMRRVDQLEAVVMEMHGLIQEIVNEMKRK